MAPSSYIKEIVQKLPLKFMIAPPLYLLLLSLALLLQTLFQQARKSISHGDFTVVISCLRLIRHVHSLLPEYKAELLPLESRPYERFPRLLQQFEKLVTVNINSHNFS